MSEPKTRTFSNTHEIWFNFELDALESIFVSCSYVFKNLWMNRFIFEREYVFEIPVRSWNGSKKTALLGVVFIFVDKTLFFKFLSFPPESAYTCVYVYVIKTYSTPLRSLIKTFWEYGLFARRRPSAYLITDSFSIFREIKYLSIKKFNCFSLCFFLLFSCHYLCIPEARSNWSVF